MRKPPLEHTHNRIDETIDPDARPGEGLHSMC